MSILNTVFVTLIAAVLIWNFFRSLSPEARFYEILLLWFADSIIDLSVMAAVYLGIFILINHHL